MYASVLTGKVTEQKPCYGLLDAHLPKVPAPTILYWRRISSFSFSASCVSPSVCLSASFCASACMHLSVCLLCISVSICLSVSLSTLICLPPHTRLQSVDVLYIVSVSFSFSISLLFCPTYDKTNDKMYFFRF